MRIVRDPSGECVFIEGVAYHKDFFKQMSDTRPWETGTKVIFKLRTTPEGTRAVFLGGIYDEASLGDMSIPLTARLQAVDLARRSHTAVSSIPPNQEASRIVVVEDEAIEG
jgi:hypothetical protein